MTIRYLAGVLTENGDLDTLAWMGLVRANLPVGRCDVCETPAYGFTLERYRGLWHAEARCTGRGAHTASMTVRAARPVVVAGRKATRRPEGGRVAA